MLAAIVGVGPGLGLAVARRFGRAGYKLALLARKAEALKTFRDELTQAGFDARTVPVDASRAESIKEAFFRIEKEIDPVDVLVYNASVLHQGLPSQLDPLTVVSDFKINVVGALASAQAVLPSMRAKKRGTIIFTGSGVALEPYPDLASLAIGKAGIRSLALSFAKECADFGVHACTLTIDGMIEPGTPFAPDTIAEKFWELHSQAPEAWQAELVYRG
jgi:short-subunit dehydrogenase